MSAKRHKKHPEKKLKVRKNSGAYASDPRKDNARIYCSVLLSMDWQNADN